MSARNLLIGTPAYAGQIHVDYLHAVMSFYRAGVQFSVLTMDKDSLITRARNAIISQFHTLEEFTHLLFLDGDVYIDGQNVNRLLEHDKDVIGAAVPLKGTDIRAGMGYHR